MYGLGFMGRWVTCWSLVGTDEGEQVTAWHLGFSE